MKALISVYNKSQLDFLTPALIKSGYQLVSSGGTAKYIKDLGYDVTEVEALTNLPELLGGRVKTMHPKILAGILARKDKAEDLQDLSDHDLPEFDLVVVNLYPFQEIVASLNVEPDIAIENIDIGGVTLLRSAAKNFKHITVLSNPKQYKEFVDLLSSKQCLAKFRSEAAIEVFRLTATYDQAINNYLSATQTINFNLELKSKLRYGENPQQAAGLYVAAGQTGIMSEFQQLQGKELSFNNLLDMQAAYNVVSEYDSTIPCVAIVKHNNPCGVAIAPSIAQAYVEALSCDTVSAFGGIVAANKEVNLAAANEMISIFLELVIAPSFTKEALEIFSSKPNLRVIAVGDLKPQYKGFDIKVLDGGYLVQEFDTATLDPTKLKIVTKKQIEEHQWVDLLLAWRVAKHCKSNAVVAVLNGKTIGIGCGQTNRVKAVTDALSHCDFDTRQAVLASDGFFPFADNIDIAAKNHISAIIQPGGSIRDQEVIDACDAAGIAMVFTNQRSFRH